jgi:dTDP-4-amino-4,6-dideoxygalactose transaminase
VRVRGDRSQQRLFELREGAENVKLKPFNSFGAQEYAALLEFFGDAEDTGAALSGYLAGRLRGGYRVVHLESEWAKKFKVKHAIACNSATSGLMTAAFAIGLRSGDQFACPAMTMSATAAAPMFTGATPFFCDVNDETFSINPYPPYDMPIFATNLFGHPAQLDTLRRWCDTNRTVLIEDNSQSPFAWEGDKFAGTIGDIGVFSLNVHKPLQCGEGGMIVTDDDDMAARMRAFINHGEHVGPEIGLNLRMPEVCAVNAMSQLQRGDNIVTWRIEQASAIISAIGDIPGLRMPVTRAKCRHVYYTIPFLIERNRAEFCDALRAEGVPIVEGYVDPLYRMPAFAKYARECPVAEELHDRRLFYFENCAYDVTPDQIAEIGAAFRKAAEKVL